MKVFFVGSPRALKEYKKELLKIYNTIEQLGHKNLYHLIANSDPDTFYKKDSDEIYLHFDITSKMLHAADIIIVEASIHSLTLGYLVRMGEELDKPVIVFHLPNCEPFFFAGNKYERFVVMEYTFETVKENLEHAFEYSSTLLDIRFNLFLSPQINSYLRWITKKNGISRSMYIRQLLKKDLEEHTEFIE